MLRSWRQRWQRRREEKALSRRPIPDALWQLTLARYPFLAQRSHAQVQSLRRLTSLFLDDKAFHGANGFNITDEIAVAIAAQACLPVLNLGLGLYRDLASIVVHADEVVAHRLVTDEDGIVHEYDEPLVGEASLHTGQVMLAWRHVGDAHALADWGYNVVIHEFAHVLDALDGQVNGIPGPMSSADQRHWADVLEAEYKAFSVQVSKGLGTFLDPYGAEGPDEFFAVAAEAFFVAALPMENEQPALYRLLASYFHQDPAAEAAVPAG